MPIRVLIVEDDEVDEMVLQRFLREEKLPYESVFARSLTEAKRILSNDRFDVVLADYLLGDGTSFDLFNLDLDCPVIIITKSGSEEVAIRALRAGAHDYLLKDPNNDYLKLLPITIESALEQKRNQDQLRMLSRAVTSVDDGVYVTDMDDHIGFVNQAFLKLYGYSEVEILGQPSSILSGDAQPISFGAQSPAQDNDRCQTAARLHRRKDGSLFPVSLTQSPVLDEKGGKNAVVAVVRDISKLIEAEQHHLMALFTELDPGPVLRFSSKGKVLMANKAATEVFAKGPLADLELTSLLPALSALDLPAIIREGRVITLTAEIGNRSFDLIVQGVPDLNAGQIYGTDITERLRLAEELIKQERLVAIGKTVADVSHSMKNIFTPLKGGFSLLDRSIKAGRMEGCKDCRESYEILSRSITRLYLLLMNMLEFSKNRDPVFEQVEVEDLFRELCGALQFEASRSNVVIQCDVAEGARWFCSDQQHLYLALLNLASNGVDAMRDGGTLKVSASRQATAVGTIGAYMIEVSDSGCGIPAGNLDRIFEAFFTTKQSKGTGLGLFSVKQFVEAQGGEISVSSQAGRGTTFRLSFPVLGEQERSS